MADDQALALALTIVRHFQESTRLLDRLQIVKSRKIDIEMPTVFALGKNIDEASPELDCNASAPVWSEVTTRWQLVAAPASVPARSPTPKK